jgi:hypothetical protein
MAQPHYMEVPGIVIIGVLSVVRIFLFLEGHPKKVNQGIHVFYLMAAGIIHINFINLRYEHREVDVQKEQYGYNQFHAGTKLEWPFYF